MTIYFKDQLSLGVRQTAIDCFYPWLSMMLCSKAMGTLTGMVIKNISWEINRLYFSLALSYPILIWFFHHKFESIMKAEAQPALEDFGFL